MTVVGLGLLPAVAGAVWGMLSVALVLCVFRLLRGPSLPDRVVALDLISTLAAGFLAVDAVASNQPVILDIAIVVSLISFLGTVAFAYYVEKGASR